MYAAHPVATGQFNEQSGLIQIAQTVRDAVAVAPLEHLSHRCVEADLSSPGQHIAQVIELDRDAPLGGEIVFYHALAVNLQDATVGKAAGNGLYDFCHFGAIFLHNSSGSATAPMVMPIVIWLASLAN